MRSYVHSFWCLSSNFGDALTPYIIKKISGVDAVFTSPESVYTKVMVTGSILNWECKNSIVWGCGLANRLDTVPSSHDIQAVRGPISKYIAESQGVKVPKVYGDPALLLPRLYTPSKPERTYTVGIIPHYVDLPSVLEFNEDRDDVLVINVLSPVEIVLDQIASCGKLFSSSLHGIIASHAYNKPCKRLVLSDNILGDGTKFMDYFASIGQDVDDEPLIMKSGIDVSFLVEHEVSETKLNINLEALYDSCPFLP
jgi:pyruvyltransferase